jgi:hypothetical protein
VAAALMVVTLFEPPPVTSPPVELESATMPTRALLLILAVLALLTHCVTYLANTNFYGLQRGITKQQFLDTWQRASDAKNMIGGRPAASQASNSVLTCGTYGSTTCTGSIRMATVW